MFVKNNLHIRNKGCVRFLDTNVFLFHAEANHHLVKCVKDSFSLSSDERLLLLLKSKGNVSLSNHLNSLNKFFNGEISLTKDQLMSVLFTCQAIINHTYEHDSFYAKKIDEETEERYLVYWTSILKLLESCFYELDWDKEHLFIHIPSV